MTATRTFLNSLGSATRIEIPGIPRPCGDDRSVAIDPGTPGNIMSVEKIKEDASDSLACGDGSSAHTAGGQCRTRTIAALPGDALISPRQP